MNPCIIDISNLNTVLNGKVIHKDFHLKAYKGNTTVILGLSGSGKSVLLKILMKILHPLSGSVLFHGENILEMNDDQMDHIRKKMSVVFQGSALFDFLSVYENVGFYDLYHKILSPEQVIQKAEPILQWVGLHNVGLQYPGELSGGMRKRVAIARAIMTDPEVILFDEPTTGLDPIMTDVFNDLINRLKEERGITSLVVTHDIKSAYKIADEIYMLYKGEVIFQGLVQDIQKSKDPRVQQFIKGSSKGPIQI